MRQLEAQAKRGNAAYRIIGLLILAVLIFGAILAAGAVAKRMNEQAAAEKRLTK